MAHRLSTIADAHLIVVLKEGVVAETGSHSELLAAGGLYAELWSKQAHQGGDEASSTGASRPGSTLSLPELEQQQQQQNGPSVASRSSSNTRASAGAAAPQQQRHQR